jgi:uncharacterized repeat protein (TIGR02059 family)
MTYDDLHSLDATNKPATTAFAISGGNSVTNVAVNGAAHTVTLTLADAVQFGDVVTVGYTDPSGANNSSAIQDVAGNDAITITDESVTNDTPAAPVFDSATVNALGLVMHYTHDSFLDATNVPLGTAFDVEVNGVDNLVTNVSIDAALKTVTLTLTTPVTTDISPVTVRYTDPTSGNDLAAIQDAAGHDAASLLVAQIATWEGPAI